MMYLRPLDGEYDWSARCQLRPGTQPQPPARRPMHCRAWDSRWALCRGIALCLVDADGPRGVQEARVLPTMELRNLLAAPLR